MLSHRRFSFVAAVAAAGLLLFASIDVVRPAAADPHEEAKAYVNSIVTSGLRQLTGKNLSDNERRKRFLEFFYKYVDSPNVEQSLVGHYWEKATPEQQAAYRKLLEDYLTQSYAASLTDISPNEHIDVQSVEDKEGRMIVHTLDIDPASPPPSRVDWILVSRPDGLRVGDVVFQGVSAVDTLRSDFMGAIRNAGGKFEAILSAMKAKIATYASAHK